MLYDASTRGLNEVLARLAHPNSGQTYPPWALVVDAEHFQFIDEIKGEHIFTNILRNNFCSADRAIRFGFDAIVDAIVTKSVSQSYEDYPQKSLIGMKKGSMQMEQRRQEEIEFGFVNFRYDLSI